MMRTILIILSVLVVSATASAQSWQELMDSTQVNMNSKNLDRALIWGRLALAQAEKEFGKDTNYIKCLSNLFLIYLNQQKLDSSIIYCTKSLELGRQIYKDDNRELADNIGWLGYLFNAKGEFEKSELMYKESLAKYQNIFKGDHPDIANRINDIAVLLNGQGRFSEAESLYKESLNMQKRLYNGDHPNVATGISNLGYFYYTQGNLRLAEVFMNDALEMYKRINKEDHPDIAMCFNNLAGLYQALGRINDAESMLKDALEIYRRLYKNDNYYVATCLNNLATLYKFQNDFIEAEKIYNDALEIFKRIYKGNHPYVAGGVFNLGLMYQAKGRLNESEQKLKESLEMYKQIFKGNHPLIAMNLYCIANLFQLQGNLTESEPLYKESLDMYRRLYKVDNPDLADCLINQANLFIKLRKIKKADTLYNEAIEIFKNYYSNNISFLSEKEKEQFWNKYKNHFENYYSFLMMRYNDLPKHVNKMYDNCLFTKAILISSNLKVKNNIINSNNKNLIRKYEDWLFQKGRIAKFYTQTELQRNAKGINLDSIIKDANKREKELSKLSEEFGKEYERKQVTWEDVQSSLKLSEAAIELVRFRYFDKRWTDTVYYSALIIKKNSEHPEFVLLSNGNDLENTHIINYHRCIFNKLEDKDSYTQFWEPIAKMLKGIKRVYISPDGVYNQINLATLMNPTTEHYLSDDIDIRIVTSTRDLVEKKMDSRFRGNDSLPPVVELFGDPMFNLDSTKHLELASAISENRTRYFYYLGNTLDSTTRGGIRPLPSTRTEIEQIANEFSKKGWKVNSHLGEKALEEALKGVDNPKVLHIATHGKFLKDVEVKDDDRMLGMETKRVAKNPLLRSFLLFSGAENTLNNQKVENQNTDDGLLTAYEAMNLNLDNTDLVVLSACETGLGEIKNGEGVYGLQRAFQQAGAKSIIMSLWTVPDKETQELMTSFYSKWLNGKDKRTAFNEARNEMRDKYHYPYYWGGFVMVGE